ncbi:uncharacterized protein LOC135391482 isoform X2 [Ornithodoros turicata]|uniref:uncharacterized protein LOC135391482 isoform X2 n=1 Tax=Ornithodoros turicata TaxID=34597 RepID=UPI003139CFD7
MSYVHCFTTQLAHSRARPPNHLLIFLSKFKNILTSHTFKAQEKFTFCLTCEICTKNISTPLRPRAYHLSEPPADVSFQCSKYFYLTHIQELRSPSTSHRWRKSTFMYLLPSCIVAG